MKRILLYALILAVVWVIPTEQVDVAQLRPVEVIAIYKNGNTVILQTDTEDIGTGSSAAEALKNMRSLSPAVIYLDTAEFFLIGDSAGGEAETLRKELKDTVRLCSISGKVDIKSAAKYLSVHGALPKLRDWRTADMLPLLRSENDRLKISEYSEKRLDNG